MKKIYLLIILSVIILSATYLNLSYSYIFDKVGKENLQSPDKSHTYSITAGPNSSISLIYVALGDSLTSGIGVDNYRQSYPYLIAENMSGNGNIILKDVSYPGFTSSDLKNTLLPLAVLNKPDVVTLFIGINDVRSGISKDKFKENYGQILKGLKEGTSAKIYAVNIPFLGSDKLILPPYNYYFDFRTNEFNKIIKDLAQENNASYIDLYSPTMKEFRKSNSYYSSDLFHPSAKGYAFWAETIYADFNN